MTSKILSQAFLDESGGPDTPYFVLGGYVGPVEMWKRFSEDWQAVLDQSPAWPPFHAVECEGGEGGFQVLDAADRKRRLGELINVIAKHRPHAVLTVTDISKFKAVVPPVGPRGRKRQTWKYPYEFNALHLIGALCQLEDKVDQELGTIEIIFDHIEQFRGSTGRECEERVLRALQEDHPDYAMRLIPPRWPKPKEQVNYIPLQAADLLVWHFRRYKDHPDGKYRRAFLDLRKAAPFNFAAPAEGIDLQAKWVRGHC